ncbi:hypothetical protein A2814_00665 [Candidatus Nomurabacteria bacterium RIFCSPHIGHO2_01_FULL_38_19]|uniref:Cell division protein FtsL n=1 Tax=Candidatus Nomurabacteria bacterium RIFCSPHIGHO2_01_FULL_38_19 TaxID=1801732 RepID=A0A1F6UV61_9BACT|nr:MAG: hypothetical protein A2814_00665 [Candidatus Nomurabacteria bacterium RIFCSPHIGHO2_01_FULL_38_19]
MRQATLKLKMYAPNANMANNPGGALFSGMLWFMAGLAVLYVVFLSNMVFNIIERKALETEAHTLINQVGELELTYLYMSSSLDLDLSRSMGFKEAKANFAVRQPFGLVSKSNSNEI